MNRKSSIGAAIAIAALIAAPASATECTNGGLTRDIDVVYSDPGQPVPCEVIYDKSAEGAGQHSLWSASSQAGYCESQATRLADKLRSMGWTCVGATAAHSAPDSPNMERAPDLDAAAAGELLGETPPPASDG